MIITIKKYYILLIFMYIACSGCVTQLHEVTTPVNETFQVKELHTGFAYGKSFYQIMYYSRDQICQINSNDYETSVTIYVSKEPSPKLVFVSKWTDGYSKLNNYNLYVPENVSFSGIDTTWTEGGAPVMMHQEESTVK